MNAVDLYSLMAQLFPINRSLTGQGVRETLDILGNHVNLRRHNVLSGSKHFDWTVPKEWKVKSAYISDMLGNKIIDFQDNNLHLVGYSKSKKGDISKEELLEHLHFLEELPTAIPYITSYYSDNWGFCISYNQYKELNDDFYHVEIDTEHFNGKMDYADYIIEGDSKEEIIFSTYICHPSMASNELSGPVVTIGLIKYLENLPRLRYTYRFVFVPETIGSIVYINQNYNHLKNHTIAGFIVTCVGDDGDYSLVESPYGQTLADRTVKAVLKKHHKFSKIYSFLERGSDERQYCFPNIDLPFVAVTRTKFYEYPEYHTSLDNLDYTSPKALENSLNYLVDIVELMELNELYLASTFCEPQLGKRGLYPLISTKESNELVKNMMNVLAYCDGNNDVIAIINRLFIEPNIVIDIIKTLKSHNLIRKI